MHCKVKHLRMFRCWCKTSIVESVVGRYLLVVRTLTPLLTYSTLQVGVGYVVDNVSTDLCFSRYHSHYYNQFFYGLRFLLLREQYLQVPSKSLQQFSRYGLLCVREFHTKKSTVLMREIKQRQYYVISPQQELCGDYSLQVGTASL